MSSTAISIPRPARWSHTLVAVAAGVLVALIVTVSLVVAHAGGTTTHPARSLSGGGVSTDCLFRAPGRAC